MKQDAYGLYDLKYFYRCLLGLLAVIAIMFPTSGNGFIVMFVVLFMCLSRKNNELLFCVLVMIITITMSNGNIVRKGGGFAMEQRLLTLTLAGIMVVRIAGAEKSRLLTPFLGLLGYVFYMIIPSCFGWNPTISLLKIFLFLMVYAAYFGVANSVVTCSRVDTRKIRSVFLVMATYFIFGSMLILPFPAISQLSWEQMEAAIRAGQNVTSLFTGMTFHSQALGPLCATIGAMLFADLVFSIRKPDKLYIAMLVCVPFLIWKTSSRTALGSFAAGIAFAMFFMMRARGLRSTWKSKVLSAFMMIVIGASMAVMVVPSVRGKMVDFALKTGDNAGREVTFESVTASRRGKWDVAMYNFKQSPLFGNGFQVDEDMQDVEFGLTTMSAPVEKGVWISAILEEGGVVGFGIFCVFVISIFMALAKHKCYQGLVGFFMLIVTNFGEFTMFSMTSTGGLLWAIVFIGVVLDVQRIRDGKRALPTIWYGAH